jgi:DNA-binding NarL/FixJ family response regulator
MSRLNAALRGVRVGRLLQDGSFLSEPTTRQLETLSLAAKGLCNRRIGDELCISAGTVKVHLQRLYTLWNCRGRTQAVVWATKYGYLDEDGNLATPTAKLTLLECG